MATTVKDFLAAQKVLVEAIGGGSTYARVFVVPVLNLDALMDYGRFPMAVISDTGGKINPHNGVLENRGFTVTILETVDRDEIGEAVYDELLDRADEMVDALNYKTDESLHAVADGDVIPAVAQDGGVIVWAKTIEFVYEMRRS